MKISKKLDLAFTGFFALCTTIFVYYFLNNPEFLKWCFERHQNILSWYIRPLFLIPYCYFAFKRSLAGIFCTLFLLLTSMFWFPAPETTSEQARTFLDFEQKWLLTPWDFSKTMQFSLVPISLFLLALTFWKSDLKLGVLLLILIMFFKVFWSYFFGGKSGGTVLLPAVVGLFTCLGFIFLKFKK